MSSIGKGFVGAAVMSLALGASAVAQYPQSYYDDVACRQWADSQVAPMRAQASSDTVGSTLGGAALGAALGAAIGGGRGAGIGAASGAVLGAGSSSANADAYIAQQYNGYYAQCMASRTAPQRPPAGYAPAPSSASQLNQ